LIHGVSTHQQERGSGDVGGTTIVYREVPAEVVALVLELDALRVPEAEVPDDRRAVDGHLVRLGHQLFAGVRRTILPEPQAPVVAEVDPGPRIHQVELAGRRPRRVAALIVRRIAETQRRPHRDIGPHHVLDGGAEDVPLEHKLVVVAVETVAILDQVRHGVGCRISR
jgi:hypothetical protein